MFNHGSIGQIADQGFMPLKTLGVEFPVKFRDFAPAHECNRFVAAAKETGPVARGKGRHLIEKEERGVALAHGFMLHVLVVHITANPMDAGPAAFAQGLIVPVKLAAAIAHHEPTSGHRNDLTVWLNAVLQGHGREPEW